MLTRGARFGFYQMVRIGCYLKVVPYRWNSKQSILDPPSKAGLFLFHTHEVIVYCYLFVGVSKFMLAQQSRKPFPMLPKILSLAWSFAFTITSVAFFQLHIQRESIMVFANRLLRIIRDDNKGKFSPKLQREKHLEAKSERTLSWYMYTGLLLLATNPGVHTLITAEAPCTPLYVSSSYFKCQNIGDNIETYLEKAPFLAFELYTISMFLYMCSFFWSFIFLGLGGIATELRKLRARMAHSYHKVDSILLQYRQAELIVLVLNDTFCYFLMAFPVSLFFILSTLLYGTIKLWHIDPQSNLMFPVCGARCAFEAVTPLSVAGHVNKASDWILSKWKQSRHRIVKLRGKHEMKYLIRAHRSCKSIRCTSGSLYTFENSIVLCSINNCSQLTLNLLVSFKRIK